MSSFDRLRTNEMKLGRHEVRLSRNGANHSQPNLNQHPVHPELVEGYFTPISALFSVSSFDRLRTNEMKLGRHEVRLTRNGANHSQPNLN